MNRRRAMQSFFGTSVLAPIGIAAVGDDPPGVSAGKSRAKWLYFVADDFVVDIWKNGDVVPLSKRTLLHEIYGATVERVDLELSAGDWLAFHVVNNRLRWNGCRFFGMAAMAAENETTIVSNKEKTWSFTDKPAEAPKFISVRDAFRDRSVNVIPPEKAWDQGVVRLNEVCGGEWRGQPIWGEAPSTYLKLCVD
jgi:hypothetical protein